MAIAKIVRRTKDRVIVTRSPLLFLLFFAEQEKWGKFFFNNLKLLNSSKIGEIKQGYDYESQNNC
jgi:hypothetical protein